MNKKDPLLAVLVSLQIGLLVALAETYQWFKYYYPIIITVITVSSFVLLLWQILIKDKK